MELGDLGWGTLSPPPPPMGVLGGRAPYEKIFRLQRPLDSFKINSNFNNCGNEVRQKSQEFYGIKEQNNREKELVN